MDLSVIRPANIEDCKSINWQKVIEGPGETLSDESDDGNWKKISKKKKGWPKGKPRKPVTEVPSSKKEGETLSQ